MTQFGLTLSSEEHSPTHLVEIAVAAEEAGLDFVSISDHFHPWISEQGHSPFVWSVLGAIANATHELKVGVGVSCPIMRVDPAISAHAVATTSLLFGDRFTWGVGTGEALNEHVHGDRWPPADVRIEMLEEAIQVIRRLWEGDSVTHRGRYFTVEDARIFDAPNPPPPILVSAFGTKSAEMAAELGDGLWTTGVKKDVIEEYRSAGGEGPVWSQLSLCWDEDRETALERAHRVWAQYCPSGPVGPGFANRGAHGTSHTTRVEGRHRAIQSAPWAPSPSPSSSPSQRPKRRASNSSICTRSTIRWMGSSTSGRPTCEPSWASRHRPNVGVFDAAETGTSWIRQTPSKGAAVDDNMKLKWEGRWDQLTGKVKQTWGDLTDDDLDVAEGNYEELVGRIKEQTGESREEIEEKLNA